MLNIGTGELLVVVVVGLLVLRPEDLPVLMRKLGAAVSFLRQQTIALQRMLMNPYGDETDSEHSVSDKSSKQPSQNQGSIAKRTKQTKQTCNEKRKFKTRAKKFQEGEIK